MKELILIEYVYDCTHFWVHMHLCTHRNRNAGDDALEDLQQKKKVKIFTL
jgi:hypothetical protein